MSEPDELLVAPCARPLRERLSYVSKRSACPIEDGRLPRGRGHSDVTIHAASMQRVRLRIGVGVTVGFGIAA